MQSSFMRMDFQQVPDIQPGGQALVARVCFLQRLSCAICQCRVLFYRRQGRNWHTQSFLPHSIYCSFLRCPWRGHLTTICRATRKWNAENSGQGLEHQQCQIYELDRLRVVKLTIHAQFSIKSVTGLAISAVKSQVEGPDKVGI
jgi:hypothetical protein